MNCQTPKNKSEKAQRAVKKVQINKRLIKNNLNLLVLLSKAKKALKNVQENTPQFQQFTKTENLTF